MALVPRPALEAQNGSGYPLLTNGQSRAISPLRLLALQLALGRSITAEAAMKLLIALTFMYLLCRRLRLFRYGQHGRRSLVRLRQFSDRLASLSARTMACFLRRHVRGRASGGADHIRPLRLRSRDLAASPLRRPPGRCRALFSMALMLVLSIVFVQRPFPAARDTGRSSSRCPLTGRGRAADLSVHRSYRRGADKIAAVAVVEGLRPDLSLLRNGVAGGTVRAALLRRHTVEAIIGPGGRESITGFAGVLGVAGWLALLLNAIAERRFPPRDVLHHRHAACPRDHPRLADHRASFLCSASMAANARIRLVLGFLVAMQSTAAITLLEHAARVQCSSGSRPWR